jgi:hypothetical protein
MTVLGWRRCQRSTYLLIQHVSLPHSHEGVIGEDYGHDNNIILLVGILYGSPETKQPLFIAR